MGVNFSSSAFFFSIFLLFVYYFSSSLFQAPSSKPPISDSLYSLVSSTNAPISSHTVRTREDTLIPGYQLLPAITLIPGYQHLPAITLIPGYNNFFCPHPFPLLLGFRMRFGL